VKTTTILNAYIARQNEWLIDFYTPRGDRQRLTFRAALLSRIEAGDRAREQIANIVESFKSHLYEEDAVMEIHNMLRKDGIDV